MRRIGVLMVGNEADPERRHWLSGFVQRLAELGWTDGRNVQMDVRWAAGNLDRMRMFAKELIGLRPDVILSNSTPVTAVLQRETRTIPIVFVLVVDPVGEGFVASLPDQEGISPASSTWKPQWEASGFNYSRRLRPPSSGLLSCLIPTRRPVVAHISCPHSRPLPDR
jgi:putative ABC transport system substrate-binding protein